MPGRTIVEQVRVIDGTGAPAFLSDVALSNRRIEAIQPSLESVAADCRIDGRDLVLTPGFIDVHTHSDLTVPADPRTVSQSTQGVTAQVVGNCGFSAAPLGRRSDLKHQMLGPVPDTAESWSDFASYRDCLDRLTPNTHITPLVGHAALRHRVSHDPLEPSTAAGIRRLVDELEVCFDQGARGLSLGLEYLPGSIASQEELLAVCTCAGARDAPVTVHVRNRDVAFERSIAEVLQLALDSGARLHLSHIAPKYGARDGAIDWLLGELEGFARRGPTVTFDEIPYEWGTTKMAAALPQHMLHGDPSDVLQRLAQSDAGRPLREHTGCMWKMVPDGRWDLINLVHAPGSRALEGKPFLEVARRLNTDPWTAAAWILAAAGDRLHEVLWIGHLKDAAVLDTLLLHEQCLLCSDGITLAPDGPLAGAEWSRACYGWAARALTFLTERGVTLEAGVHRLTGAAAAWLDWPERGRIAVGAPADLVLIDPSQLRERATYQDPHRPTAGIEQVWLGGEPLIADGTVSHARNGQVL